MGRDQLIAWLDSPQEVKPGTAMPDLPLTDEQIKELAAFLTQLRATPESGQTGG